MYKTRWSKTKKNEIISPRIKIFLGSKAVVPIYPPLYIQIKIGLPYYYILLLKNVLEFYTEVYYDLI